MHGSRSGLALLLALSLVACRRPFEAWQEDGASLDPFRRRMTALAVREAEPEDRGRAIKGLWRLAADTAPSVRLAARESLAWLSERTVAEYVAELAAGEPASRTAKHVALLGEAAVAPLAARLSSETPEVCRGVATALARVDAEAAHATLAEALTHPDEEVRRIARRAVEARREASEEGGDTSGATG